MRLIVGPITAAEQLQRRLLALGARPDQIAALSVGTIRKADVDEWIGVPPPEGGGQLRVDLVAPESVERGGVAQGWVYADNGCFNHTDLLAVRILSA